MGRKKVAVLISGRGSNLQALIDACAQPDFPAEISMVLSNRPDAIGLKRAEAAGIATHVLDHKAYDTRAEFDDAMHELLSKGGIDIVCLAGFMRLPTGDFVERWEGRMINIHPSLLPSFRGLHTHERALESGVRVAGCTVHFVVPEMDAGPIITQAAVPVLEGDSPDSLAARVLEQEHICYPLALKLLAEDRLEVEDQRVHITKAAPLGSALVNPGSA